MEEVYTNDKQFAQINSGKKNEVNKVDTKYIPFFHAKSVKLKTLNELSKSLCKIKLNSANGTGFFLKINTNNKPLNMLVTAHHVVSYRLAEAKANIVIILDDENSKEKKSQKIKLDVNKRKMIFLAEEADKNKLIKKEYFDLSAIEIIDKDNLKDKVNFLEYDLNCKKGNYNNYLKDAFILHHPYGVEDLKFSSGNIVVINDSKRSFEHTLDTNEGSSGSPIFLIDNENDNPKVIAVHTSAKTVDKNNIGIFIDALIQGLK